MATRRTLPLLQPRELPIADRPDISGASPRRGGVGPLPLPGGQPDDSAWPQLTDAHGRRYRYLRISVTDRCNMACQYCMPPGGEDDHALRRDVLSFEQIMRISRVFNRMGVSRLRLTGGEPLLRKGLPQLIEMLREQTDIVDMWLTTNGARLPQLAAALAAAGLAGVNVSLDSLRAERFATITRGGVLEEVLAGIDAAQRAGLQVKLNAVALRGLNDDEIPDLTRWAWARGITPRFIELMPLGEGAHLLPAHHLSTDEVRERLQPLTSEHAWERDPNAGPAYYLRSATDTAHKVGIIGAISDTFCSQCNRVRLTSRGEIIACIASRSSVPLKALMEAGASDGQLANAIQTALFGKSAGHRFTPDDSERHGRGMSLVGG